MEQLRELLDAPQQHKMVDLIVGILKEDGCSVERYLLTSKVVPDDCNEDTTDFYIEMLFEAMVSLNVYDQNLMFSNSFNYRKLIIFLWIRFFC